MAFSKTDGVQPGLLAHGPEEKLGLAGRMSGLTGIFNKVLPSSQMGRDPLGGHGPQQLL